MSLWKIAWRSIQQRALASALTAFAVGLGVALDKTGISHVTTRVGDRYVMEAMLANGAVLGGEDSGHTVFRDHQTTGDGMLTALKLIEAMLSENKPLSELKSVMTVFPQVLINVEVKSKPELKRCPRSWKRFMPWKRS